MELNNIWIQVGSDKYHLKTNDRYVDMTHEDGECYPKHVPIDRAEAFVREGSWKIISPPTLTVDDLVEGEIYYHKESDGREWINKYIGCNNYGRVKEGGSISITNNSFYDSGNWGDIEDFLKDIRLATQEEKDWLNACIKADKFIPKGEIYNIKKEEVKLLSKFPSEGCVVFGKGKINHQLREYIQNTLNLVFSENSTAYDNCSILAWNTKNYWYCNSSSKKQYKFEDLKQFLPMKEEQPAFRFPIEVGDTLEDPEYGTCVIEKIDWEKKKIYHTTWSNGYNSSFDFNSEVGQRVKKVELKEWWKGLKKGDYVVCLRGHTRLYNHVCKFSYFNKEGYLYFENKYNDIPSMMRKATPEEAVMYEDAGKPVDVTTYKMKKQYKGRAVHTPLKEQFEFVCKKYNYSWNYGIYSQYISLNGSGTAPRDYYIDNNYQILSFKEWLDENGYTFDRICETCNSKGTVMIAKLYPSGHTEVDEECPDCNGEGYTFPEKKDVQFEVGEWYKRGMYNVYIKFKEITKGGNIRASEDVSQSDVYCSKESGHGYNVNEFTKVSLEEVRQYLPEGHPDKLQSAKERVRDIKRKFDMPTGFKVINNPYAPFIKKQLNDTLKGSTADQIIVDDLKEDENKFPLIHKNQIIF